VTCWDDFAANPGSAYVATGDGGHTDIPDGTISLVVTDPPYMDNVHYSELADFFHAWLRGIGPYPGYPTGPTTRDEREVQNTDADAFRTMAANVWRECARVLSEDGLLAFSFHQSHASGWEAVMRSLADANFFVTAVRPVVAEVTTSLTKAAALAPNRIDVIIVCRKAGVRPAQATPAQARGDVMSALLELQKSGLTLGDGDALSAARAAVLSLGTYDPGCDWEELRRAAEVEAKLATAELSATH
jgi:adenine-specific DNA methylase